MVGLCKRHGLVERYRVLMAASSLFFPSATLLRNSPLPVARNDNINIKHVYQEGA